MTPVVVDPKQAANALRWAVREMEERYKNARGGRVRNIDQYTQYPPGDSRERTPQTVETPKRFPHRRRDRRARRPDDGGQQRSGESIARLAQMARAVGNPSEPGHAAPVGRRDTGLIKANLPARIAFRVASKIDSRTILDGNGAEQLLGKGDMLLLPPASSASSPARAVHLEQESARLASYLRKQGKPVYDETINAEEKSLTEAIEMDKDDLYDEAARSSCRAARRRLVPAATLRIGFSPRARLWTMMEMEGLVSSPAAGGKPREVLVDKQYFDEVDAQLRLESASWTNTHAPQ